ncbi:MAG TPA: hypothetical protein VF403_20770 [Kofleriaceae bacterium]
MKLALVAAALAVTLVTHSQLAHAIMGCMGAGSGWASGGSDIPPHAHLVLWSDRRNPMASPKLVAKIANKVVRTKVTTMAATPYQFVLVEIDSDATGHLDLTWDPTTAQFTNGSFEVVAKPTYAKKATVKTSRYHREIRHTGGPEIFDGLEIAVDVPAVRAHVKLRRDAKATWTELDVPVRNNTIDIGLLGCVRNYEPGLLETGVDIDLALTLPDGSTIGAESFTHAVIDKQTK